MQREMLSGYRVGKPDGGPECEALERELEAYYGVPYARVFNSCTSALHASVVAIGGDDWLVPSISMSASASCVLHAGKKISFFDIDDSYEMIGPRQKLAVIPHLFGHHQKHLGLMFPVLHDCAQSPSVKPNNGGNRSNIWCYSFNQWKVVSSGEGGYALTYSKEIADRLHAVRNHGECFTEDILGYNYRMTEMQAAIARKEFRDLDIRLMRRRVWAHDLQQKYDLPSDPGNIDWFLYPIRTRPEKREAMAARIPGARVGYHKLIPDLPWFKAHGYSSDNCPNSRLIESELVVIDPMFYGL